MAKPGTHELAELVKSHQKPYKNFLPNNTGNTQDVLPRFFQDSYTEVKVAAQKEKEINLAQKIQKSVVEVIESKFWKNSKPSVSVYTQFFINKPKNRQI